MTIRNTRSVVSTFRTQLAAHAEQRRARRALEHEIAQFRTAAEREELSAILDRNPGPDADVIRRLHAAVLAGQRS